MPEYPSYRAPELIKREVWKQVVEDYFIDRRLEEFNPLKGACFFFKGRFIRSEERGLTLKMKLTSYPNGRVDLVKFEYVPQVNQVSAKEFERQEFKQLLNVNSLEIEAEGTNAEVYSFWNELVFPRIQKAGFEFRGNRKQSECNSIMLGVARYVEREGCIYKNPIDLIKLCSSTEPSSSWVEIHADGVSLGVIDAKNKEIIGKYGFSKI